MKKVFLVCCLAVSASLYCQELLPNSQDSLDNLIGDYLYLRRTVPFLSCPLLPLEVRLLRTGLADSAEPVKDNPIQLTQKLEVNFQAFYNDRDKNPLTIYKFLEKEPLARLGLGLADPDKAGFYIEAFARSEFGDEVYTNLFNPEGDNPVSIDNYFIQYGYFYYDFNPLTLVFGRIPVHFGHPGFNTVLPSKRLPFMDSLYLKLPIGFVTMNMMISSLENREGVDDVNPDAAGAADNTAYEFGRDMIMTALHRFDMHWKRLNVSISGFSIISRQDNTLQLGDFFPVFSWHNADVGWHNLSMVFEASYSPLRGMDLFAQAGYDDINASDLFGIDDTGNPTIDAYILGALYRTPLIGAVLSAKAEFGYTHYLWGNFYDGTEADNRGNHVFERAIYRYRT
ncbi:MAG: hypothetical protein JW874_15730, partial [Spirochaetales bacterium]|nr:hypothetical protein [Spirochaetales bacterium]